MNNKSKTLIILLSLVVGGGVIALGVNASRVSRVMASTRSALEKGYPALAFERIDSVRRSVIKRKDGCSLLLDTYYASRKPERLEWAAEFCMDAGQISPEVLMGWAASYEMIGQDERAAQILQTGLEKYGSHANLYWRLGEILKRNKNPGGALKMFVNAAERAPENQQMALTSLQLSLELKENEIVKAMAMRLKEVKTNNPEIKLLIARGLKRGGDAAGARVLAQEALPLMASLSSAAKTQLEKAYQDVFIR